MPRALFLALVLVTGCNLNLIPQEDHKQQTQATLKPVVAIAPVIDSTEEDSAWSLSDEFTYCISHQLAQKNHLSLIDLDKTRMITSQNPFRQDISWLKKVFSHHGFVVFLELVEHNEMARQDDKKIIDFKKCSAELLMTMRVRVFDLRGDEPKIVLQELVHESHFIPRPFTRSNFQQEKWSHEMFTISPMGLAHSQFIKHICNRLEDYILLAAQND
ncbi:MAG TPA: CT253 family lipoprotein [Candidatus Rhabdochlamydia sp.]|jgi:hypothetical protein|nr:CT253 family lipoprotein [Candidatus Rhabdochlamydia sp.]